MSDEEKKSDEDLIVEVSKFLKEVAVERLIRDLINVEGVPTDSESLEAAFHSHGINMRYLGFVNERVKKYEFNHLKVLIEREILFRSAKHIFNE